MRPSKNDDLQSIGEPGAELSTEPWLTDLRYGGMSPRSAELSYRAAMKRLPEDSSVGAALPDYNEPPPKSLAEYGLSPDAVTEQIVEHTTSSPKRSRPKFTPFHEILLSTTSRYLVKGIIPNVGLVVVWGPPKCGKSFFIFDLVAHIAGGWEYRGRRVKQAAVVYFALEGQEGFLARVEAFRQVHRVSDMPFYLSADRILLPRDGEDVVRSIIDQFPDVHPGVVVLDTLNRSIAGSENDPADMGQYVRAADMIREAFNCVVIIIHHCGIDGSRPRGHTSLTGAADAQIAVKRDPADNIVATVEFMKDGPTGDEIVSLLEQVDVGKDEDGDIITSCVIRTTEAASVKPKARVTGQAADALRVLQDTIVEVGVVSTANGQIPPGTRTISEKLWRANCYAGMTMDDTTQTSRQKAFVRASNKLQEQKLIGIWGDHVWLV
jgi:AAA domain